jgi:two-component system sensor histidine kinase TctE
MLSIERLDGLAFKPERGEMISFLKDNAAVMARKSMSRDVVFEFSCNVSAVTVDYDPILMQEALTNIFENALAHGGDDLKNIIFQVDASTSNVTIKISNDGQPITSITRTKIFDRFSQGQESQGAGLGLAIVDEIMSLHEGTVELVHNDPVSFNLTLKR